MEAEEGQKEVETFGDGAKATYAEDPEQPPQPQDPKPNLMDKLSGFINPVKQRMTCTCTKVTWRFILLGISLWQIADMVSDGFQTKNYWTLASVSMKHQLMKSKSSHVYLQGFF